jgi:F-type H+-transporting ATPase subunit c
MMLPVLGMIQAANQAAGYGSAMLGRGIGAGLVVFGAAIGIGLIGSRMTESMARQPEIAGNIQTGAIILSAFIEGAALFGLVIAFLIPAA